MTMYMKSVCCDGRKVDFWLRWSSLIAARCVFVLPLAARNSSQSVLYC